jgi:hypothetical protein
VVIGTGPKLMRVARAFRGEVRCVDVRHLAAIYGTAVAGEIVSQVAVASVRRNSRGREAASRRRHAGPARGGVPSRR